MANIHSIQHLSISCRDVITVLLGLTTMIPYKL